MLYCLSYRNAVCINIHASRNIFSLFYEYLEHNLWLAVCLQLYALHSSLPSESPFKSYVTDFLRLIFFFFCVCPFYFFHFHILCLFPSVLVLSVLTSSGGSVKLRVVFWLECGGGLEFRWRAAGHHEGVWSDVSSEVSISSSGPTGQSQLLQDLLA